MAHDREPAAGGRLWLLIAATAGVVGLPDHLDAFRNGADGQAGVESSGFIGLQLELRDLIGLKSRGSDGQRVSARRHCRNDVGARAGAIGHALRLGIEILQKNLGAGDTGPTGIGDGSVDLTKIGLRPAWQGGREHSNG